MSDAEDKRLLRQIDRFKVTSADTDALADLRLVISNVDLETFDITTPALRALEKKKGVYFWMMRYAGARYKIYVGKTNSLARRGQGIPQQVPNSP
jgi:hypothetical protein